VFIGGWGNNRKQLSLELYQILLKGNDMTYPKTTKGFKRLPNEIWTEIEATNPKFQYMLQGIIEKNQVANKFKGLNKNNSMMLSVGAGESLCIWRRIRRNFFQNRIICIHYHSESLIPDVDLIRSAMNYAWAKWGRRTLETELSQESAKPYLTSFRIVNWKEKYMLKNHIVLAYKIPKNRHFKEA
jgi:hypothetical protein